MRLSPFIYDKTSKSNDLTLRNQFSKELRGVYIEFQLVLKALPCARYIMLFKITLLSGIVT